MSSKSLKNICVECKFNPNVVISHTEAKRKYKLTDEEIDSADLFFIQFKIHGNIGTKYLISEIETLADKLTKDIDLCDKRKQAYLKQKEINDKIRDKQNKIEERTQLIKTEILELIKKYGIEINNDIDTYINTLLIKSDVMNIDNMSVIKMVDNVNKMYIKNKIRYERKARIDRNIEKLFNKKYHQIGYNHYAYREYIESKIKHRKEALELITKDIQKVVDRENREKEIIKEIKKRKLDYNISKALYEYNDYINGKIKNIDNAIEKIKNKHDQIKLKIIIDSELRKENLMVYKDGDLYKNCMNGQLTLEKAINKMKERERRKKDILDVFKMTANHLNNISDAYSQYIHNKITLDNAIIKIKEDIEKNSVRKKGDKNYAIKKIVDVNNQFNGMPEQTPDQRKCKLNCFINRCIGRGNRKIIWEHPEYIKYVKDNHITFAAISQILLDYKKNLDN